MIGPGCEHDIPCALRAQWNVEYVERPAPDAHGEGYTYQMCDMHTLGMITRLMVDPTIYNVQIDRL
jgi:hypothetical protein